MPPSTPPSAVVWWNSFILISYEVAPHIDHRERERQANGSPFFKRNPLNTWETRNGKVRMKTEERVRSMYPINWTPPFQGHAFIGDSAFQGQTGRHVGVPPVSPSGSLDKVTWKWRLCFYSGQWPVVTMLTLTTPTTRQRILSCLHGGGQVAS